MQDKREKCVRPNPKGDWPEIDPTAYVDVSAQVIGRVRIGAGVFVGPNAVIRADEVGKDGEVEPIVIEAQCNVQDGVIVHALAGTAVQIGSRTSLAHGAIVHGLCVLGEGCFVGFGATLFGVRAGNDVFFGVRSIVQDVELPAKISVPAGLAVVGQEQVAELGTIGDFDRMFMQKVVEANIKLVEGYLRHSNKT